MNTANLSFISILLVFTFGCHDVTDSSFETETKRVTISSSETFEYKTGISGDEEGASITTQAEHYETSKMIRNAETNFEAVYKYKPAADFKGSDHVALKLSTGSDGASSNTNIKVIKIEITVE